MDGRCYGCATKFGFFNKEHACHKCGHAYCKTCLPHKAVIPGKDPQKQQNVCSDCYKLLQQPDSKTHDDNAQNEGKYSPPENFKKRVAALHEKQTEQGPKSLTGKAKSTPTSAASTGQAAKYKNLAPQDRDIAIRLAKLQEERKKREKPALPVNEIEERLRKLQGRPPSSDTTHQNVYQPPSKKTQEEEYDDLLEQMSEEAALDSRLEGRDIPHPATSHYPPSSTQSGLGGDPLIPSEEELRQISEDAKNLLGNTSQQTSDAGPRTSSKGNGGGGQQEGINDEEAKRLEEEARKLMEEAKVDIQQEEERAKKGAERDAEIAGRLAQLQNQQPSGGASASVTHYSSDEEDEEKATQRLIQKLLEEDRLDEKVASDGFDVPAKKPGPKSRSSQVISGDTTQATILSDDPKPGPVRPPANPDELPWCCICNEDAILRCLDCDGDLYCKRCFREGHEDFGMETHKIKPYKAPSK